MMNFQSKGKFGLSILKMGKEKLEIVGKMAQRMWDASPYDVKVHLTLDRREALKDADFVYNSI